MDTRSSKTEPWFVTAQRARKADAIVRALMVDGVDALDAARFTSEQRSAAASKAFKPPPSDRTWRSVVEMLAGSLMPGAQCPTCGLGDPQGEPGPKKTYLHDGPCAR